MTWGDVAEDMVVGVGAAVLGFLGGLAFVAAALAGIAVLFWAVGSLGIWMAAHHPAVLVFLVFVGLLLGSGSRGDAVADRLGDIHTTLLMRR